ncbi:histidine phosphatase family protein [Gordonia jinghuaiqii]|uniref:Histidine phosphatase family protein n=1 Tax=Gordonia jinghuaiqii TaxID=2758710 RepID=A0A7D7R404_9ACTN|nr:histidine phosphatase family protein [Gordonia jinghuaiqii]MCR5980566.1 histidine phosphatase family protein [Gordonia jinghuaiqii]QMT02627.1 histidine phosphatase family protein [Gordonia jinghuaiqii]
MILSLVRHGEPVRAASGDAGIDPPLSAAGADHARGVGKLITADGYSAVYSSPLRRARETAQIAAGPDVPVGEREGLSEFDRGSAYLHYEDGAEIWKRYLAGDLTPWGTTLDDFRTRVLDTIESLRADHDGENVVAVCHGGVINVFTAWILGVSSVRIFAPEYGSVHRFWHRPGEGWSIRELNVRPWSPSQAAVEAQA